MNAKHLTAVAALGALSLVVACSGGNGGVVPGTSGSASVAAPDDLAIAIANAKSPIKLSVSKLDFTALGSKNAKKFTASETNYKGNFTLTSTCDKNVTFAPAKPKGPKATITVTPDDNAKCTLTVSDKAKNKATLSIVVSATITSPTPSSAPGGSSIVNGNFASGSLAPGWKACSFSHNGYAAPIAASPAPAGTGAQASTATAPIPAATLAAYGDLVATPPPNLNPNNNGPIPSALIGQKVAETGDQNSENTGASGICQTFTVSASSPYLSFWAYEGGSEYNFEYADQEADILDSTGTTVQKTLFAEDNCFWDPGKIGQPGYLDSGCIPAADGSTSSYTDWQGGYWVERGPYNLSAYAGQSVTLYLGVWDDSTHNSPYPDTYSQEMFVGNVQTSSSSTFPSSFPTAVHQPTR